MTVHTSHKIKRKWCRDDDGRTPIVTDPQDKTYRVSFIKRRRLQDNTSVPFGYIKGRDSTFESFVYGESREV